MTGIMVWGTILITLALVLYTIGVWAERLASAEAVNSARCHS